jgi:hypothetical protein
MNISPQTNKPLPHKCTRQSKESPNALQDKEVEHEDAEAHLADEDLLGGAPAQRHADAPLQLLHRVEQVLVRQVLREAERGGAARHDAHLEQRVAVLREPADDLRARAAGVDSDAPQCMRTMIVLGAQPALDQMGCADVTHGLRHLRLEKSADPPGRADLYARSDREDGGRGASEVCSSHRCLAPLVKPMQGHKPVQLQ